MVSLMQEYKDFAFINYILGLEFKHAYIIYLKTMKDKNERLNREMYWDLYLVEIQNGGYEGSFEDYYKEKKKKNEVSSMDDKERDNEESRILAKYKDKKRVRERVVT